jgi:hypothetical protein
VNVCGESVPSRENSTGKTGRQGDASGGERGVFQEQKADAVVKTSCIGREMKSWIRVSHFGHKK